MKAVAVLHSRNIRRSLAFYTDVLAFRPRYPQYLDLSLHNGVVDLVSDGAVIQLSIHMGATPTPSSVNVELDTPADVDNLFAYYVARGLEQSHRTESPVHLAPLDQTWGTREVYINDPDGNCLCLRAWL